MLYKGIYINSKESHLFFESLSCTRPSIRCTVEHSGSIFKASVDASDNRERHFFSFCPALWREDTLIANLLLIASFF